MRAQLVELGVDAVADDAAVAGERRRLVDERRLDAVADVDEIVEPAEQAARPAAPGIRRAAAAPAARRRATCRRATRSRGPAVPRAPRATSAARGRARVFSASRTLPRSAARKAQFLDRVEAIANRLERDQRRAAATRAAAGRPSAVTRAIDLVEQRSLAAAVGSTSTSSRCAMVSASMSSASGRLAQPQRPDVREVGLLRVAQVAHEGAGGRDGRGRVSRPKPSRPPTRNCSSSVSPARAELERPRVDARSSGRSAADDGSAAATSRPAGGDDLARRAAPRRRRRAPAGRAAPAYSATWNSPVDRSSRRRRSRACRARRLIEPASPPAGTPARARRGSRRRSASRARRRARPRAGRCPWPCAGLRPARRSRRGSPS